MPLAVGSFLGAYEILAPLGAGGMGEVYRARDTRLGREVAVKILAGSVFADPESLARLRREAQLLAALNHPNIAAIHAFDEANSTQFLVLELVDGETLDQHLARGPSLWIGRSTSPGRSSPRSTRPTSTGSFTAI
jgi:eukaryotic-like serine/threonine-protein kinase